VKFIYARIISEEERGGVALIRMRVLARGGITEKLGNSEVLLSDFRNFTIPFRSTYEKGDIQQSFLLRPHVQVAFGRGQDVRVHPVLTTDADEHHAADQQEGVLITAILCEQA